MGRKINNKIKNLDLASIFRIMILLSLVFVQFSFFHTDIRDKVVDFDIVNETGILKDTFILESEVQGVNIEGNVKIIQNKSIMLEFKDFKITNRKGIDIIMVSKNNPKDIVYIDTLRANIGDFNFNIPVEDLDSYDYILFWDSRNKEVISSIDLRD